jgi:hypothetical protein
MGVIQVPGVYTCDPCCHSIHYSTSLTRVFINVAARRIPLQQQSRQQAEAPLRPERPALRRFLYRSPPSAQGTRAGHVRSQPPQLSGSIDAQHCEQCLLKSCMFSRLFFPSAEWV